MAARIYFVPARSEGADRKVRSTAPAVRYEHVSQDSPHSVRVKVPRSITLLGLTALGRVGKRDSQTDQGLMSAPPLLSKVETRSKPEDGGGCE